MPPFASDAARRRGAALLLAGIFAGLHGAAASERQLLVPNVTIYPREVVRADNLSQRVFIYNPDGPSSYVERHEDVVGLAVRTTLPAHRPIPLSALEKPRLVSTGAPVQIRYGHMGLDITALGVALQNGAAGETVRVRNSESGVTIMGVVEADGAVKVVDP